MKQLIKMLKREELFNPIKCTCAKCNGEAWIMPIPKNTEPPIEIEGVTLCSRCTFGEKNLTLIDMINRIFNKDHPKYIGNKG